MKSHDDRLDRLASRTVTRIWQTMADELTINPDEAIRLVRQAVEVAFNQGRDEGLVWGRSWHCTVKNR